MGHHVHRTFVLDERFRPPSRLKYDAATSYWMAGNKAARLLHERALAIDESVRSAGSRLAGEETDI